MINYIKGDATQPKGSGPRIVPHVCNDAGRWGKGFVMAVSRRWPTTREQYLAWHGLRKEMGSGPFALGSVQFIQVDPKQRIVVANMIGQSGTKTGSKGPPIRYDAVRQCLEKVAETAKRLEASIHAPRFGCGLAGGSWAKIEPIIEETLCSQDLSVTVYDFE